MSSERSNWSVMTELPSELVEVICCKARHLAELALERRRDRGGHHLRGSRRG